MTRRNFFSATFGALLASAAAVVGAKMPTAKGAKFATLKGVPGRFDGQPLLPNPDLVARIPHANDWAPYKTVGGVSPYGDNVCRPTWAVSNEDGTYRPETLYDVKQRALTGMGEDGSFCGAVTMESKNDVCTYQDVPHIRVYAAGGPIEITNCVKRFSVEVEVEEVNKIRVLEWQPDYVLKMLNPMRDKYYQQTDLWKGKEKVAGFSEELTTKEVIARIHGIRP